MFSNSAVFTEINDNLISGWTIHLMVMGHYLMDNSERSIDDLYCKMVQRELRDLYEVRKSLEDWANDFPQFTCLKEK